MQKKKMPSLLMSSFICLLLCSLFIGCGGSSSNSAGVSTSATSTNTDTGTGTGTGTSTNANDHESSDDYTWSAGDEQLITLLGTSISTTASNVVVSGSTATISASGTYRITGSLSDGRIIVSSSDSGVVRLILEDVNITCSTNAPIDIESAAKTIIVIDGTSNTVTDGASYVLPSGQDEPNAALYSKDNLTIYGINGSLTVNGNNNDGIGAKDGLILKNAVVTVNSVDDGIRGKDYLVVRGGTISVVSTGDGLKSDNSEDSTKGFISVESGAITVTTGADGDALQAETDVIIADGSFTLTTGGGSSATLGTDASAKGIKGVVSVLISGGTFTLNTADDGVHSNGSITVTGGSFSIATGDDGMHADSSLEIDGGAVNITKSFEGIESAGITITGGTIHVVSSDDGVNGSGDTVTGAYFLNMTGGYLAVTAAGDGIDINGSIAMSGGTVIVHGPIAQDNGAIDYDATFNLNSGFVVAAGSSGMAQAPSTTSAQHSVKMTSSAWKTAGTLVHIQNSSGIDILTFAPAKTYQSVVFSSPNLVQGATYSVYIGGSSTGTVTDGLYSGGVYSGGTLKGSFTVTGSVSNVNIN